LVKQTIFPRFSRRLVWLLLLVAAVSLMGCMPVQTHWQGVSAVGERVYVAHGSTVLAVDMASQQLLWQYAGEGSAVQFYAPPAVDDGRIIIGDYGSSGGLFSTGLTVSVYSLSEEPSGAPRFEWKNDSTLGGRVFAQPLYLDDLVIIGTSDNQIVALDPHNGGRKVWSFQAGNAIWSKPATKGNLIFVSSVDRNVYALQRDTGALVWQKTLAGANASSPVVNGDLLYVGSFDKTLHAFEIETGAEVWTAPAADWIWGAPLYHEGTVYYTDLKGNVYAVDAQTGESIWAGAVSGSVQAAPVLVNGVLYIASTDPGSVENPKGYLTAFRAEDGEPAWATVITVDAPIHASPVVVGNTLVVAVIQNDSSALELIQYDLQTGNKVWSFVPSK
jgi:outer membrane protein assembly factor BamB